MQLDVRERLLDLSTHSLQLVWRSGTSRFHLLVPSLINSLRPCDAYMRWQPRPSLVQVMACCLFGTKPLSEPMLAHCQLDHLERTSVKFYQNSNIFIQEYAFENVVCKNADILFWPQCVDGFRDLTISQGSSIVGPEMAARGHASL